MCWIGIRTVPKYLTKHLKGNSNAIEVNSVYDKFPRRRSKFPLILCGSLRMISKQFVFFPSGILEITDVSEYVHEFVNNFLRAVHNGVQSERLS